MHISIVSPVYYGEKLVDELVKQIDHNISPITSDFEIILVEDGSPDRSWDKIEKVCKSNERVKGIQLSRNFGQHYAITAGLSEAKGDWVVVMDCDLQDRPDEIPNLYNKAQEGYDAVFAQRHDRQDSFIKRITSKAFFSLFSYMTNTKLDPTIGNFGIYKSDVVSAILSMKDHIKYFPTMSQWVGFKKTKIKVQHARRAAGESSYNFSSLFNLAFNSMIAFSDKPLRLTIKLGLSIALFSFLIGGYYLYRYFTNQIVVLGYASLIISIWFLSGLLIFILGVFGLYLGKTFDRVKDRPVFIIREKLND